MRIWHLKFEVDKYDNLIPCVTFSVEQKQAFDGRSLINNWTPIRMKRMEPEKGLELGDAPGFSFPVFSNRALECLFPLIGNNIEVLPLDFEENEYWGINIVTVLDAIDYEKSIYKTFRDGKRIMCFNRYSFLPKVVENVPIFKIIDEKTYFAFVSDEFKKVVEDNKLSGFRFELVWDSEQE